MPHARGAPGVRGGSGGCGLHFGTRLPQQDDGLLGEIATVFNGMVDQLSLFTSEVTRVARVVAQAGGEGVWSIVSMLCSLVCAASDNYLAR